MITGTGCPQRCVRSSSATADGGRICLFEPFLAHKIANHVLPGVLAHYNHNEYLEQRRDALAKWASTIESLAAGCNVIPLHRQVA